MRPLWAEAIRAEPHGRDESLVEQILEHRRDMCSALPTRLFAAEANGNLVAHAELYCHDGVGQVEDVATLPQYRKRGYAKAVVARAVEEAEAAGAEFVFLVAMEDDWPKELYRRLGFDVVGRYIKVFKGVASATNDQRSDDGLA
jgi:ribosomal protein S18 acetylase RimI-like enzyme